MNVFNCHFMHYIFSKSGYFAKSILIQTKKMWGKRLRLVVYRGHSYTRTIFAIGLVVFDALLNFSILIAILKKDVMDRPSVRVFLCLQPKMFR